MFLELLKINNGDLRKTLKEYDLSKKIYSSQRVICNSYGMEEKKTNELLKKHNGNLKGVFFDYYENQTPKDIINIKKDEKDEKVIEEKKEVRDDKKFPGRVMILKSYGFDEEISRKLLIKHKGNMFKVLSEYQTINEKESIKGNFIPSKKKSIKKDNSKIVEESKPIKDFTKKLIVLKSNGFDEKKCFELLTKHEGDLQKVLSN